jgi:hypothetical protein
MIVSHPEMVRRLASLIIHVHICASHTGQIADMKLVYFAGPGMADSIRSVMHHASIPLEFEGLSDEQFAAAKASGRFKARGNRGVDRASSCP